MGEGKRNQFKKLRYKNTMALNPDITVRKMADITGLGASTISKIEREGVEGVSASTIKAYYDAKELGVSYEYLFGETNTKEKEYYELGKRFPFDDSFYKHLEELLALDGRNSHFVEYMLAALLYHPQELYHILRVTFDALYTINNIQADKELPAYVKSNQIRMQEYIFNQSIIRFLEDTVMPLLQRGFNMRNEEKAMEAAMTQESIYELDFDWDAIYAADKEFVENEDES